MRQLKIIILLVLTAIGCSNSPRDVTFEISSVSSGEILDGNKVYESHDHEWKSSDGEMVSVDVIKFASKNEVHSYLGNDRVENMRSTKYYDGRLINEAKDTTTNSITLWKGNKIVKIKAPTLGHALAFEKCCSERAFNNF